MRRALELASAGWGRVAPNPLVGAVVVDEHGTAGEGFHAEYGGGHAEVEALRAAGARSRGATLYVSLEPCAHHGKTPPCTRAILAAGVRRVVFAASDPHPQAGGGAKILRDAGVEVLGGVEAEAARELNAPFFFALEHAARPWIALKLALSLDARIADAAARSSWITGGEAREEVHRLRAGFDAVGVGIGTALADDPRLTVRGPVTPRVPPVRVVFDRLLRLSPVSYLARTARQSPVWVVCDPAARAEAASELEALGVRLLPAPDLSGGLRRLRDAGVRSLLCEGGAGLASALVDTEAVDRLYLFYAPVLLGAGGRQGFAELKDVALEATHRWRRLETRAFGGDTLITLAR